MNRGANIGVIQQYEKRKEDVSMKGMVELICTQFDYILTQIARLIAQIRVREKNVQRMEKNIQTARVSLIPI